MYHSVDSSGSAISIEPEQFRAHVRWLATSGVRVLSVPELLRTAATEHALAITFDDALASFGDIAWPLLRDAGLPASVFVPSAHVGGSNAWNPGRLAIPALPLMTWDALARAAEEGLDLAAHTRTHPSLWGLPPVALYEEIVGGADAVQERTGVRPSGFAYPFGDFDAGSVRLVRARFDWACTTELRALGGREDPHLLPRIDAYYLRDAGRLERLGSPRLLAELGARRAVRRVRTAILRRQA